MINMQFVRTIEAAKQLVWNTLWNDKTFRDWAGIIDPGTYMVGELTQGSTIQYISAENGYGVTTKVEKLVENEYLLLRHTVDTQDAGKRERDAEWTGGTESYALSEANGVTTLTVNFDVPAEQKDYFEIQYPKALDRVKFLAENNDQV